MTQQDKQQAIDLLRRMVPERRERLADIDPRLADYYDHLCRHSGTEKGDANDLHNGYELLCALRLLRRHHDARRMAAEPRGKTGKSNSRNF